MTEPGTAGEPSITSAKSSVADADEASRLSASSSPPPQSAISSTTAATDREESLGQAANQCLPRHIANHGFDLLYIGKLDLPYHPVRMRHLPYSGLRYLLYGKNGFQEMTVCQDSELYSLQEISWETLGCDCVQTKDLNFYVIARCHTSSVLAVYDEFMFVREMAEVSYPQGCLSSVTADRACQYLYGTNQEMNCVLRFSTRDPFLDNPQRFGALWRPFDCCTSQAFNDGAVQYLFVSNLDAGICVFELSTMKIVAECGRLPIYN
uniref:DUF5736 domain-containing protein n=1 Tax=Macrostomum lignano TaxID=282301 RepID=A0A1I8GB57_9PLAT